MISSPPDADQLAPKKADTAPVVVRTLADWERELDACMQAVYGCSLAEYGDKVSAHFFALGREQGAREGRAAGRRAAKGLKKPAKKRGRPSEIHEGERNLLIDVVKRRRPGQTIRAAASRFLQAMQAGERIAHRSLKSSVSRALQEGKRIDPQVIKFLRQTPRGPITSAAVNKAVRAYYRHCRQKKSS